MPQESEIITLLLGLIAVFIARNLLRPGSISAATQFRMGLFALIAAYVFTVVEGERSPDTLRWYNTFNLLEHLCYALSAWMFVVALLRMNREPAETNHNP